MKRNVPAWPGIVNGGTGTDDGRLRAIAIANVIRTIDPVRGRSIRMTEEHPLLDQLFSATYEELRRLAALVRSGDPSSTLNPTALVNEAYVKLAGSPDFAPASRLHFKRIAARAMRQVLIEAARRRNARKRGADYAFVTFDEEVEGAVATPDELLALDTALEDLGRAEPRQALMVEYRFFGGLDVAETASALGVSEATVARDWRAARAWLSRQLREER